MISPQQPLHISRLQNRDPHFAEEPGIHRGQQVVVGGTGFLLENTVWIGTEAVKAQLFVSGGAGLNCEVPATLPPRNVNLTDELDRFVAKRVKTGRYENASEVVRAGSRTLEREEQQYEELIVLVERDWAMAFSKCQAWLILGRCEFLYSVVW
jgi:putative addiction module CopG family antidote